VTQPDRPAGRGRTLSPPPVKLAALELDIPVYQPESLRDVVAALPITAIAPDVLIVVAYGELLRRHVLELAPHGCLNVHPSLLPAYRGAAPIPAAILNGDRTTGVSIIRLVRRLDAGPLLVQQELDITNTDTTASLSQRLAVLAAVMLPEVALAWTRGEIATWEQDEAAVTHTREWTADDARIIWDRPAAEIERLVRASNPWPVAWTTLSGERFRVLAATVGPDMQAGPGEAYVADKAVLVATGDQSLRLDTVQAAGKRPMPALDWWRGLRTVRVQFE
jgi:methionyl-tRNA formyltransferase